MAKRTYVADLPGGTATTTIQIQNSGTLSEINLSLVNAAAGSVEVSTAPGSQIGTAQPTNDVLCRVRQSATASHINVTIPVTAKLSAFQSLFIHQTGAGNLGEINFVL